MLLGLLADGFLILGVVLPYVFQARIILGKGDVGGWSVLTSFLLLTSSLLRCFFWYCKRFDGVLLVQALCSIATQLAMTWIVVHVGNKHASGGSRGILVRRHTLLSSLFSSDSDHHDGVPVAVRFHLNLGAAVRGFWRWTDFRSYVIAIAAFTLVLCVTTTLFSNSAIYREGLGVAALGIEALVPVPQAWQNQVTRSTAGLSAVLVLCWAAGDLFKTILFTARSEPLQFLLCGFFQLSVDILLFVQLFVLFPADGKGSTAGPGGRFDADYRAIGSADDQRVPAEL
jgi:solute carrier family 66, member 2